MRNCQFSFLRITARYEGTFSLQIYLYLTNVSPYLRPIPQARLAKTPLFAAPILSRNYL